MPEYESNQQDTGCSKLQPLDPDTSHQVSDYGNQKHQHQRIAHNVFPEPLYNYHFSLLEKPAMQRFAASFMLIWQSRLPWHP